MLPKICYEDTLVPDGYTGPGGDTFYPNMFKHDNSEDGGASISGSSEDRAYNSNVGWHVDPKVTYSINFYKTDQNDCFDQQNYFKDKQFFTLSFIYEV